MATDNKKMKDPAEAALTAVEQALNFDETFVIHTPDRPTDKTLAEEPRLPDIDDHDFTRGPFGLGSDSLSAQADDHDPRLNRSEEHTSELQSRQYLVCRLLLEKKNTPLQLPARAS